MTDLAGRGPLGQKPPKTGPKLRKAIPHISKKRAAYLASQARQDGLAHMCRVKMLPCICCGHPPPSYAHHVTGNGKPRDDMSVLPLCYDCHQGPNGYHAAKAAWVARYGPDCELLPMVQIMLESGT